MSKKNAALILEDGTIFYGNSFGSEKNTSGEVVFNTGMVGYPETLTDPSYHGQILTLTYPLVGNYGVPRDDEKEYFLSKFFESEKIQVFGLVVSECCKKPSHWNKDITLSDWLKKEGIPGIEGIDTRTLTKKLREKGVMLGKIIISDDIENKIDNLKSKIEFYDPDKEDIVSYVTIDKPHHYKSKNKKATVMLLDCGVKNNIIRLFLKKGVDVIRVPYDYDIFSKEYDYDAIFISNGPGNPKHCEKTILNIKKAIDKKIVILGICLGNQLLALASGADTYKLKYGHRSHNQPCIDQDTKKCYITSQNHGFAVDEKTLKNDWEPWFVNANDNTNEGIKHKSLPFYSVQFHPEANSGPVDTEFLFDKFIKIMMDNKNNG